MTVKKVFTLFLAFCMVLGTIGFTVFADETTVHNVSNDAELAEAIKTAVDGDTIKLASGNYTGGISVGKDITLEGSVDENGNPTTVFSGNNSGKAYYQYSIYMNKGTIKDIKIVDAWKGIMTEGKGSLTIDNVTIVEAGYGIHIAEAKGAEDIVLIQNCNIDITWANSFARGEYAIVMKNNVLTAENPYYGEEYGANLVNTFAANTTIADNVFGENAKILIRDEAKDGVEIGSNYYTDGFENALSEDCADGVKIETYYADKEMTEVVEAPKGTITPGYATVPNVAGSTRIWGDATANAKESFVVELYAGEERIATTSLNDYNDIIDGDLEVTWSFRYDGEDTEYWDVEWAEGNPVVNKVPTKVVLIVDGVVVDENVVKMNSADNLNPIEWNEIEGVSAAARIGKKGYGSLEAAFAAAKKGDVIELISDVTLTEGVRTDDSDVLSDITLDGNDHTVTLDMNGEGTGIRFGGQWATGVKIRDLTIDGSAKYALWLNGGTSSVIENLTITGDYDDVYGGLILFGTHGATLTNCDIVSGFTNGQDDYPLNLVNTKIGHLSANNSEAEDGAKVFVDEGSSIETVVCGGDNSIMIDSASIARIGTVLLATGETWADTIAPVAEVAGVYYASFNDALAAAQADDTIDLLGNEIVLTETVDINIDGLTIKNGSIDISNIKHSGEGIFNLDGTRAGNVRLTLKGIKLIGDGYGAGNSAVFRLFTNSTLNISDSTIDLKNSNTQTIFRSDESGAKVTVANTVITLDKTARTFANVELDMDNTTITATNIEKHIFRNVSGTVDGSTISVDGAEYGMENDEGVLTFTNSTFSVKNTVNAEGNTGIKLADAGMLVKGENAIINAKIYIDDGTVVTVYNPLIFDTNGGSEIMTLTLEEGTEVDLSGYAPTKSGYTFKGWYADEDLKTPVKTITLTDVTTVYAKWQEKRSTASGGGSAISYYTVKFETNGGNAVKNQSVRRNNAVSKPADPTKEGFTFEGWYTDKELTTAYDFTTKVTKGITLYAKWSEIDVTESQIILTIGDKNAKVFGENKANDVAPKVVNGRTMLPARFVAENLGAEVEWNEAERKVTITRDDIKIVIVIDSDTALVGDKEVKLDSPAFIENDRTYTPVRFIAESLGEEVEWNEADRKVTITKK